MYIGHIAVALAVRGLRPDVPLWLLVLATQGCDWIEIVLRPFASGYSVAVWSHSIPAVAAGAAAMAVLTAVATRSWATSAICACVYASHIPADYVTGLKPTWPGAPSFGWVLYDRPGHDFLLEATFVTAAWMLYRRSLPPGRRNAALTWALLALLVLLQGVGDLVLASSTSFRQALFS